MNIQIGNETTLNVLLLIFVNQGEKTSEKIGVVETILATSLTNLIFGVFAGQPLILYGATGPVLVFEKHLFSVSRCFHIFYMFLLEFLIVEGVEKAFDHLLIETL